MKFQRPKIVFNAKYVSHIKDQPRHFVFSEVWYKARPWNSLFSIERYSEGVDVVETLQNHNN